MLAWARRIADGQWPYRDFWSNYAPGQPLLLAALVKLFGPSLLWWRIVRVAIDATVSVLAFAYVRRHAGTGWALRRVGGGGGGDGVAQRPRAQPAGAGARASAPCCSRAGRRWAPARSPAWPSSCGRRSGWRPRSGRCSRRGGSAGGEPRRRGAAHRGTALVVAVLALAPFAIVAGGDMADQVLGFASTAGPPAPALPAGLRRRLRPRTSCSSSTCPRSSWPAARCGRAGRSCAATASPWRPWSRSGSPTCSRAPTSSTWCRCRSPSRSRWRAPPAARRSRRRARRSRWRSRSSLCTAWSDGPARRCTRRRWRPSRRAAADGVRTRRPTPPRCAA